VAALIGGVYFAGHFLHVYPPLYMWVAGTLALVSGLVVFARFVRRYPLLQEGEFRGDV
jgi:cytochrome c biogenesis protein CcdA